MADVQPSAGSRCLLSGCVRVDNAGIRLFFGQSRIGRIFPAAKIVKGKSKAKGSSLLLLCRGEGVSAQPTHSELHGFSYFCRIMGKKFSLYNDRLDLLDPDSLLEYKEVVSRYPYCQYAQLMLLLNLKKLGDEETYRSLLSRVAISVPDRDRLKLQVENIGNTGRLSVEPDSQIRASSSLPKKEERMPWAENRRRQTARPLAKPVLKAEKENAQSPTPPARPEQPGRKIQKTVSDAEARREQQIRRAGFVPVVEEQSAPMDAPKHIDVEQVRAMLHKGRAANGKKASSDETLSRNLSDAAESSLQGIPFPVEKSSMSPDRGSVRQDESGQPENSRQESSLSVRHPLMAAVRHAADARAGNARLSSGELIDRFLQGGGEHPIRIDENFDYSSFDPDQGGSSVEDFSFGTETLAEMYLKSNTPEKAIAVYEHLRLKFPEKSSYFAELIRKVRKKYSIK